MAGKPKLPTKLDDIFKDKKLTDQFEEYCKKEYATDNFNFYALKSWSAQNVYKLYFAKGAKWELNLPGKLLTDIRELGEKKMWDDRRWKGYVQDAKHEIGLLLSADTFRRFKDSLGGKK